MARNGAGTASDARRGLDRRAGGNASNQERAGASPSGAACHPSTAPTPPATPRDPGSDRVPHRPGPRARLFPLRRHRAHVLAHRQPRIPNALATCRCDRPSHQHLVANDVYLVHPEHPPADPKHPVSATAIRPSGGSLSERRAHATLLGPLRQAQPSAVSADQSSIPDSRQDLRGGQEPLPLPCPCPGCRSRCD